MQTEVRPMQVDNQAGVVLTTRRFAFRIILLVLTLALWQGWVQENHFLAGKTAMEQQLLNNTDSFSHHIVDVNEKEDRYQEREQGQPFKLVPLVLWTVAAGWVATAKKPKEQVDSWLNTIAVLPRMITIPVTVLGAVLGAWMISGHANTGAFAALVLGGYVYWLGRTK